MKKHIPPFFFGFIKKFLIVLTVVFILVVLSYQAYRWSKAQIVKADLVIDTKKIVGFIPQNWQALAQGGEERVPSMLSNVIPQVSALSPRYIRIDHIYDFYDVVKGIENNRLVLDFSRLDKIVCDIYKTGARPFFSLGYMPPSLSQDGTLISPPKNWYHWQYLVQKTIERYSGKSTVLCDQVYGELLKNIYYEVWNEPDLETFGKWSIYGGNKDYRLLYFYAERGAKQAKNTYFFYLGGPATTALYKNWLTKLFDFIDKNKLKFDFISWHHYTKDSDDFYQDMKKLNQWLNNDKYRRFYQRPKIISEWGYDSNPNPIADTIVGAAHSVASIRHLIDQGLNYAFAFEIKDGVNPSWGILTNDGRKKPRYYGLQMLNILDRARLEVTGEGTYVKAVASVGYNKISLIVVNYDSQSRNTESTPIKFINLDPGIYQIEETYFERQPIKSTVTISADGIFNKNIILPPNMIVSIVLSKL